LIKPLALYYLKIEHKKMYIISGTPVGRRHQSQNRTRMGPQSEFRGKRRPHFLNQFVIQRYNNNIL